MKTVSGRAPRSMAASSSEMSIWASRERTTTVTKDRLKVVWAMTMVVMDRPAGQPKLCSMATNSSSRARPVMTSGITSGAVTMPENKVRPVNR